MTEPIVVSETPGSDRGRVKLLGGVAVGLLALVFLLPKVLGGGGSVEEGNPWDDLPAPTVAPPAPAPADDPVIETTNLSDSRDPFVALRTAAATASESPVPALDFGSDPLLASPPAGLFDSLPLADVPLLPEPAPAPGSASPSPAPAPVTSPPRMPSRFSVLEVFTDVKGHAMARVRVADSVYEVRPGEDFAGQYRVLSLDLGSRCGQFLFGDDRFSLCEGEERFN